jgi:hypothetical protein
MKNFSIANERCVDLFLTRPRSVIVKTFSTYFFCVGLVIVNILQISILLMDFATFLWICAVRDNDFSFVCGEFFFMIIVRTVFFS